MKEMFTSRWGLLASALGMAIGTGNIWRFPRVIASNGGGAFLIPYFLFLFLWAIPLLAAEFSMGQGTRLGLFGAFSSRAGTRSGWMGGFVAMVTFFILSYYAVVTGWCLSYIVKSLFEWDAVVLDSTAVWSGFAADSFQKTLFQLAAILFGGFVVQRGVVAGIEKINKILIPSILVLIIILAIKALSLEGSGTGVRFLFVPDFAFLAMPRTWLAALSQVAWSTGAGWGLMLVYATYSREKEDVASVTICTGIGNHTASLIAATAIVPTIFALLPVDEAMKVLEGGNQGLAFISLPGLMTRIGGGQVFSTIFFVALFFAAFSSLISMLELGVKTLADFSIGRSKGVVIVTVAAFVFGLPSAASMKIFNNQDWVWGLGLILSGLLFSVAFWKAGWKRFFGAQSGGAGGKRWFWIWAGLCVGFLVPIMFLGIVGWWFFMAVTEYDPGRWWHPWREYSVGTCLVQWALLLAALLGLWFGVLRKRMEGKAG
jgi:NSS family neurotransmitter:Na+ symporter